MITGAEGDVHMKGLSAKQQAILTFMRQFIDEHDYPPSIRDIQIGCDISSTSVVDYNLKALERLGHIRRGRAVRWRGRPRGRGGYGRGARGP